MISNNLYFKNLPLLEEARPELGERDQSRPLMEEGGLTESRELETRTSNNRNK